MVSNLISSAIKLLQSDSNLDAWRSLFAAFRESNADGGSDTFNGALEAILISAGITPATLGPDMIDQLVAWAKTKTRDEIIETMQTASENA
jgi:hypothetical protein